MIIDEISMISSNAFNYIDKQLQQIKDSTKPFGGITILAVGDLFQLLSCWQICFCTTLRRYTTTCWISMAYSFFSFELNQIDYVEFAALFNRVRQGHQTTEDLVTLKNRIITTSDPDPLRRMHKLINITEKGFKNLIFPSLFSLEEKLDQHL